MEPGEIDTAPGNGGRTVIAPVDSLPARIPPAPLAAPPDPVDSSHMRGVLAHFCSGIVVITTMSGTVPVGMTCQSFSSLSLDPPLVLVNIAHTATSWPALHSAGRFAVNILGASQEWLSRRFATRGIDKFDGVGWRPGATGAPLLAGVIAHVECAVHAVHPGGDHHIVVGRVLALAENDPDAEPLLYFRSGYRHLPATRTPPPPGLPPSRVDPP